MDQAALACFLTTRLLNAHASWPVEATFVFGRAKGDWEPSDGDSGILEFAAEMYRACPTSLVCIPGTRGGATHAGIDVTNTYPGPEIWSQCLRNLCVPDANIIVTAEAEVHTRGDSDAFVELCKKRKWHYVAIITQPHQVLRAMLAILASMEKYGHYFSVFPICPHKVNWKKFVHGSQGTQYLHRRDHQALELQRVFDQIERGFLVSLEKLETYLNDYLF